MHIDKIFPGRRNSVSWHRGLEVFHAQRFAQQGIIEHTDLSDRQIVGSAQQASIHAHSDASIIISPLQFVSGRHAVYCGLLHALNAGTIAMTKKPVKDRLMTKARAILSNMVILRWVSELTESLITPALTVRQVTQGGM